MMNGNVSRNGTMQRFDWIDFGYSWNEEWPDKTVDLDLHRSTASLLSQMLRKRPFEKRKIFLWMTRSDAQAQASDGVFHISVPFDFNAYRRAKDARKLALFSEFLLNAIATAAPTLVAPSEIAPLTEKLSANNYTYRREDVVPVKGLDGIESCKARFVHSPQCVRCDLSFNRGSVAISLPEGAFRRDEYDYGRSVSACVFDGPRVLVETSKGNFTFLLDSAETRSLRLAASPDVFWGKPKN
ncbi:hypothetical protein [Sandarakinorhabdus sp.]|uniref:hypothetical protein n=1 Tax=Sandarakinorhabdus sp. TaxID=1916663 RepID=UPI00286EB035|nr:hypothetical protein [Sandarakinorhabdus sp.]